MSGRLTDVEVYALRLGDDALLLSHRLSEWSASAPEIEEDIALTNIALDLLGQARALLSFAGTSTGRREDDLAYLRAEREFVNCHLVELPIGDFAVTTARQLVMSAYLYELYAALQHSAEPALAGVAGKAVKEVAYHRDHATQWVLRLGDGTAESHARMTAGLSAVWPYTAELFERDDLVARLVARGVAADPDLLRPQWQAYVEAVLAEATLAAPDTSWAPTGGRAGVHTEHLGYLLAEMQYLHRSMPGMSW